MTPAENRLQEHLGLLREQPPEPSQDLTVRVMRTARWQRAARRPMLLAAELAGAVLDGVSLLLGRRPRR
jgi:hypothetical protein